jgi:hypothetical protein
MPIYWTKPLSEDEQTHALELLVELQLMGAEPLACLTELESGLERMREENDHHL